MASVLDFVGELDKVEASMDAKNIDSLSRALVAKAALNSGTVEEALTDFLAHVLGSNLPRLVKVLAVVTGHKALDVARMVVLAERRKGVGNVQ
jgi:uncharacterized membrane protein YuzA (DUF378 family)